MNPNFSIGAIIRRYKFLVVFGLLSATLRLVIVANGGKSLFDSGQDAPTYLQAALDFIKYGWLSSQISSLPVWPAGYPFFLSVFLTISGSGGWILVSLFQHLLFICAVVYFVSELRGYLSTEQKNLLLIILFFIPSFLYSPSENMYESLLASLLLVGIAASMRLFHSKSNERYPIFLAIISFGFAGFLQAKTVPIGILIFLLISLKKRNKLFLYAPLFLWGVVLTVHRSFVAYGILSPSINYSIALNVGGAKVPCKIISADNLTGAQLGASVDRQYIYCSVKHFATNPTDLFTHMATQARALFGPLDGGGITGATTWFHGLGFQRIMGFLGFSDLTVLFRIENMYALLLNIMMFFGFILALRTLDRGITIAIALPIVIISLVHLVSDGDARYRLPFLPFQLVFLVILLSYGTGWILKKLKFRP